MQSIPPGLGIRSGSHIHTTAALHLLGVGGIGVLIIGMISSVSLGHTGRTIVAHPMTIVAFILMVAAVATRVIPAVWFPQWYMPGLLTAGSLWCIAFSLYVIIHAPILTKAREDGRPG